MSTPDPLQSEIVEGMELYVEGKLMSDDHKRECMAAYLSGMLHAMNMLRAKRPGYLLLPAVLHQKILTFAKLLGLQFESATPPAPVSGKSRPDEL